MNYAELGLFWFVALLTVGSSIMVVTAKNLLHAAFSLALCLLGVSGLYLFLHADFLAAVQLIVYVGGILVLIMFSIMFSSHTQDGTNEGGRDLTMLGSGAVVSGIMLFAIILIMQGLEKPLDAVNKFGGKEYSPIIAAADPNVATLGHVLMGEYLLPFEAASILILAALVGAVVIVRKETR